MSGDQSSSDAQAEAAEDQHLGSILVNNNVSAALQPNDSGSVAATVAYLSTLVTAGSNR